MNWLMSSCIYILHILKIFVQVSHIVLSRCPPINSRFYSTTFFQLSILPSITSYYRHTHPDASPALLYFIHLLTIIFFFKFPLIFHILPQKLFSFECTFTFIPQTYRTTLPLRLSTIAWFSRTDFFPVVSRNLANSSLTWFQNKNFLSPSPFLTVKHPWCI